MAEAKAKSSKQDTQVAPAEQAISKKVLPRRVQAKKSGFYALVIGLAVAGGLLVWFGLNQSGQATVLTVSSTVARGETIEGSDLTSITVGRGTTNVTPAEDAETVIGSKALVDLTPGSLVNSENTGEAVNFSSSEAIVGIGLADGSAPVRALRSGDQVRIVYTPMEGEETQERAAIDALVESTSRNETNGAYTVDVRVDGDDAVDAARWSAAGQAALVLDGSDE